MAKQKVVIDVRNRDTRAELTQNILEAVKDMENNDRHTGRKGPSTSDFVWKWTISAQ